MPEDHGKLRQVAWTELFPWLELLRVFRLAIQIRLLVLAAVGLVLTFGGWLVIGQLFGGGGDEQLQSWVASYSERPWNAGEVPEPNPADAGRPLPAGFPYAAHTLDGPADLNAPPGNPLITAWYNLSGPFRQLFSRRLSVTGLAFLLLCAVWADAVWAFFGAVITRLVALQVTRSERGSLRAAVGYARGKWRAYFAAPLFPLLGVLLFVLPLGLLGLLGQLGSPGLLVLSVIWPIFLVAALTITIFLIGLAFGWPLMWPTISAEGTDSFDALSRSYSYVYQRPLHYLWYVIVAGVLGTLGWILVDYFAAAVNYLAAWGVSWGAGHTVLDAAALTEAAPLAARVIGFWSAAVRLIAVSFVYTFFFSAATVIYFLLRQQVDGTETDEVFVEDQGEKFGLPPVAPDDAGVPTIAEADGDDVPVQ